ncbi:MAG: NosD domain-containing protein [Thermogladius sp.]
MRLTDGGLGLNAGKVIPILVLVAFLLPGISPSPRLGHTVFGNVAPSSCDNGVGLAVVNAVGVVVSGRNVTNCLYGVYIVNSSRVTVLDLYVSDSVVAVVVVNSQDVAIVDTVAVRGLTGVEIVNSSVTIYKSIVESNMEGVVVVASPNFTMYNTMVAYNTVGLRAYNTSAGLVYGNAFINNARQVVLENSVLEWNSTYYGNYWSDYKGVDADGDGVGDQPYTIDEYNVDWKPLVRYPPPTEVQVSTTTTTTVTGLQRPL